MQAMKKVRTTNGRRGESMLDGDQLLEKQRKIMQIIEQITPLAERGEAEGYEYEGHAGKRKAVQSDVRNVLTEYARQRQPRHIFEMGTAYGLSGLYLLLGSPDAKLTTVEMEKPVAKQAQAHFDDAGADAEVIGDTVLNAVATLDGANIDLVMIDHDKAHYGQDFQALLPHLAPGALVLADNATDRRAEMKDFIDFMQASPDFPDTHIEETNAGLLVATYKPSD